MRLATREQAQTIDLETFARAKIDPQVLNSTQMMTLAAQRCADIFLQVVKPKPSDQIVILCGPGNNGQDGRLIAEIITAKKLNCRCFDWQTFNVDEMTKLNKNTIIIDAIFGIGLNRPLKKQDLEKLQQIDQLHLPIFAIDNPTGLNLNTGQNWGYCLTAKWTCAIGFNKPGFYLNHGPEKCGKIFRIQLPYPKDIVKKIASSHFLMSQKMKNRFRPQRPNSSSKANYGNAIIVGSSKKFIGAGILSAIAAARVGAGFVTLSPIEELKNYKIEYPEFLYRPWKVLAHEVLKTDKMKTVAIGPGLGNNKDTIKIIKKLLMTHHRVVIDADALKELNTIKKLNPQWLLTPHRLELAKILKVSESELHQDPSRYAMIAAKRWNCVVLLKGFHTVIALNNQCLIIPTGNSALAKAGSGDVLTGIIAGLLAQGLTTLRAASLGSYLHGEIADKWLRQGKSIHSLMPSDLLDCLNSN